MIFYDTVVKQLVVVIICIEYEISVNKPAFFFCGNDPVKNIKLYFYNNAPVMLSYFGYKTFDMSMCL